jgi:hypothetical protein
VRIEHVPDAPIDIGRESFRLGALVRQVDQGGRNVDGDDLRAATGEFNRKRAGPAARIEDSRPARTVARMEPTGSVEVSRLQASTAVRSK